ncbi:MAG: bifunctional glutamate--cysteine ligase GshA/glutathione synthetase GshB [Simkaniaceae bacterium]
MTWDFTQFISAYLQNKKKYPRDFSRYGLEKETLRTLDRHISLAPHPPFLGSPLTNPYVTLDFAGAQLEMVTPHYNNPSSPMKFLKALHQFFYKYETEEFLWPSSMPSALPKNEEEIAIAYFGTSEFARKKMLYRIGLAHRYGRRMQTLSSIHYNFSFPKTLWQALYKKFSPRENSQRDFISNSYLHAIRNFLREGWILSYLFGASPACDASYMPDVHPLQLMHKQTLFLKYATSLRMSYLGYYSKIQEQLNISYNEFSKYLSDLTYAVETVSPKYHEMGVLEDGVEIQLNDHYLQIENEHYTRIRPKRRPKENQGWLQALKDFGIEYLEVRCLDLNPLHPLGIDSKTMDFVHLFLLYCLAKPSPPIFAQERKQICQNQNIVALEGRDPDLKLHKGDERISIKIWADKILKKMKKLAAGIEEEQKFSPCLLEAKEKIASPGKTPSGVIMEEMLKHNKEFLSYHRELAARHREAFAAEKIPPPLLKKFQTAAKESLTTQNNIEQREKIFIKGYEDLELSTQILIKEALHRKIKVDVLDPMESFIRLKKGKHVEYVKQATRTGRDTYISALIMGNKQVSKIILSESGIAVPQGKSYTSSKQAIEDYSNFSNKKMVVKPTNTNFGEGVFFIEPGERTKYIAAIERAFTYDNTVIVEEFFSGKEFRFLIIGQKVISILMRDPANVLGDGKHSIKELIRIKNHSPKSYTREKKDLIKLGKTEKEFLKRQGLNGRSVPKKGEKIYLRENSNISTGGDAIDMTAEVNPGYSAIAIKAAKACNAQISGVDMIIENYQTKPASSNHMIIEMNYNPAIAMHRYPDFGTPQDAAGAILDFLGFAGL